MFLVVSRTYTLAMRGPHFLRARSGAQVKLRVRKVGRLERNLPTLRWQLLTGKILTTQ